MRPCPACRSGRPAGTRCGGRRAGVAPRSRAGARGSTRRRPRRRSRCRGCVVEQPADAGVDPADGDPRSSYCWTSRRSISPGCGISFIMGGSRFPAYRSTAHRSTAPRPRSAVGARARPTTGLPSPACRDRRGAGVEHDRAAGNAGKAGPIEPAELRPLGEDDDSVRVLGRDVRSSRTVSSSPPGWRRPSEARGRTPVSRRRPAAAGLPRRAPVSPAHRSCRP